MSPRIFICDDVFINAQLIEEALREKGHLNIMTFENPKDVIKAVYDGDIPNLVITDFSMPEIDGVKLLCTISTMVSEFAGIIVTSDTRLALQRSTDYPVIDKNNPSFIDILPDHVESSLKGCSR